MSPRQLTPVKEFAINESTTPIENFMQPNTPTVGTGIMHHYNQAKTEYYEFSDDPVRENVGDDSNKQIFDAAQEEQE